MMGKVSDHEELSYLKLSMNFKPKNKENLLGYLYRDSSWNEPKGSLALSHAIKVIVTH